MVKRNIAKKVERESGKRRLKPPLWHSRYVPLKLLKKQIEKVIKERIINENIETLVDRGCGDLPYKEMILPNVKKFIGVDLEGNSKADVLVNPLTNKTELANNCADLVWSIQVLEHVDSPNLYLEEECNRLLKPGKKLILSTHGHWFYHPDPVDNWRWTCTGLQNKSKELVLKLWNLKV